MKVKSLFLEIDYKREVLCSPLSNPYHSRYSKPASLFEVLKGSIRKGLSGALDPALYLFGADCGTGKSTAVQEAMLQWECDGFPGGGGLLVVLATKQEISDFKDRCGLYRDSYAVLSADTTLHTWGAGRAKANDVPVLFTTHEMYRRRVRAAGSFADTSCFFYKGSRRSLTIWDEALSIAPASSVTLNAIRALPDALEARFPALANMIAAWLPNNASLAEGATISVPPSIGVESVQALAPGSPLSSRRQRALESLAQLAGYTATVTARSNGAWGLVGVGRPLPADIGPIIVLDASARLTNRYNGLPEYGIKVERLPPVLARYDRMTFHWWDRGCGKTALKNPTDRATIFAGVASAINANPDEEWLVIHPKAARLYEEKDGELPSDLRSLLTRPENVRSLHWGLHHGTNAFRLVRNVVILGTHRYDTDAYKALAAAALAESIAELTPDDIQSTKASEFKHNLYQAACRGNARNIIDGKAGQQDIYLIAPRSDFYSKFVTDTFTDCAMQEWQVRIDRDLTNTERVKNAILTLLMTRVSVSIKEIREECGRGHDKSFLTRISKKADFVDFLAKNGLRRNNNSYIRF